MTAALQPQPSSLHKNHRLSCSQQRAHTHTPTHTPLELQNAAELLLLLPATARPSGMRAGHRQSAGKGSTPCRPVSLTPAAPTNAARQPWPSSLLSAARVRVVLLLGAATQGCCSSLLALERSRGSTCTAQHGTASQHGHSTASQHGHQIEGSISAYVCLSATAMCSSWRSTQHSAAIGDHRLDPPLALLLTQ